MSKKTALGQGLDALLGDDLKLPVEDSPAAEAMRYVSIDSVKPNPNQPRHNFNPDALSELAKSIKQQGIVQPLLAEEHTEGSFMLIAGERRWRAARLAGIQEVPVIIRSFSPEQKLEIALVENIQREDLTAMEEARAYHHMMNSLDISQQELADRVGKNRSTVANSLRLLKLPPKMQKAVEEGQMSAGHARSILSVTNPAGQLVLFDKIINQSLSVREAEITASRMNKGNASPVAENNFPSTQAERNGEIVRIEEEFIQALGTKVALKGDMSKGRMEISWFSQDDLNRIYEKLIGGS